MNIVLIPDPLPSPSRLRGILTTSSGLIGHFSQDTSSLDIREGPVLQHNMF